MKFLSWLDGRGGIRTSRDADPPDEILLTIVENDDELCEELARRTATTLTWVAEAENGDPVEFSRAAVIGLFELATHLGESEDTKAKLAGALRALVDQQQKVGPEQLDLTENYRYALSSAVAMNQVCGKSVFEEEWLRLMENSEGAWPLWLDAYDAFRALCFGANDWKTVGKGLHHMAAFIQGSDSDEKTRIAHFDVCWEEAVRTIDKLRIERDEAHLRWRDFSFNGQYTWAKKHLDSKLPDKYSIQATYDDFVALLKSKQEDDFTTLNDFDFDSISTKVKTMRFYSPLKLRTVIQWNYDSKADLFPEITRWVEELRAEEPEIGERGNVGTKTKEATVQIAG